MNPVIIPHINTHIDVLDRGEGTYSGQGIAGDIPHGFGSWKADQDQGCWFAGEWDNGVPVRGVYCNDGWVDFGEFSPDLTRKGWAAAFLPDPSSSSGGSPFFGGFGGPSFYGRPPSPPDPAMQQAMAALGINDPGLFPGSRRAATAAPATAAASVSAQAASGKVPPAIPPPFRIEGKFDGTKYLRGNVHGGLIGQPKRMPDDVVQKVTQSHSASQLRSALFDLTRAHVPSGLEGCH